MSAQHHQKQVSRVFFLIVLSLLVSGFFIFSSASLGKLNQDVSIFAKLASKQLAVLLTGFVIMLVVSKINYKNWRKYALPILITTVLVTLLVFIPGIGIQSGGAKRWIDLYLFSLQPSEFFKLGLVIYFAAWIASVKDKVTTTKWGLVPLLVLLGLSAGVLITQPDIGTFLVVAIALVSMYFVSGASYRDLAILALIGAIGAGGLAIYKPYIRERIITYIHPTADTLASSYQLNQSLIAIGSGGLFGRGFGQSIQKFSFLPEPIGDSIFAVASEEFGFIGASLLISLFLLFALWGFKIAANAPDTFGRLLSMSIVIMILTQSFMNISAMLGLIPLTGDPLIFVSQGGSSLLFALTGSGIILNISRYA
ncbi:MAG: putative lipid II flippase FtsW [Candidatus Vogelbacteria bacterium]|nr:putative lipid II flippase FtsW [Candidatus Vogelbacteria bacterium]